MDIHVGRKRHKNQNFRKITLKYNENDIRDRKMVDPFKSDTVLYRDYHMLNNMLLTAISPAQ